MLKATALNQFPNHLIERIWSISDVESWVDEACALIRACQELRANNANLRDQSKQLLTSCFESMSNQWKEIGQAFSVRISEYLSAKTKLESQLKKVNGNVGYLST